MTPPPLQNFIFYHPFTVSAPNCSTTHLSSEGTLLVDVVSNTGLSWGLEAESRVAHEPGGKCCSVLTPDVENAQELMSLPGLAGLESTLPVQVDGGLLLESPLILIGHSDFSAIVVLHDRP